MLQQTKEKPQKRTTHSKLRASKWGEVTGGEGVGTEAACQLPSANEEREDGREEGREIGREFKLKRKPVYPFQHPALHTTHSPSLTEHSNRTTSSLSPLYHPPPSPCPIAGHRSHLEISKTCLYNKMYKQVFSLVFFCFCCFFFVFWCCCCLPSLPSLLAFVVSFVIYSKSVPFWAL